MRRISSNSESGAILAIVIILMLALTITGVAFLNAGVMEYRLAKREDYKNKAFYIAEGGLERTIWNLRQHFKTDFEIRWPVGSGAWPTGVVNGIPVIGSSPWTIQYGLGGSLPGNLGDGSYEVQLEYMPGEDKIRIESTGTFEGTSRIVQIYMEPGEFFPFDAAIFAGESAVAGSIINGNARIHGSIIILGEHLDPEEPPLVDLMDLLGKAGMRNNYEGMMEDMETQPNIADLVQAIPPCPQVEYDDGELLQSLRATLRVRNGLVKLGGTVTLGEENFADIKGFLDGAYVDGGFDIGGNAEVHSDNGTDEKYDLEDSISFPSLKSLHPLYEGTRLEYLQDSLNSATIPEITEISSEVASFWADATGELHNYDPSNPGDTPAPVGDNYIVWNQVEGLLTISGIINIPVDSLKLGEKNQRLEYSGDGIIVVAKKDYDVVPDIDLERDILGEIRVHGDLLAEGTYTGGEGFPKNALGLVTGDLHIAGPGEDHILATGAFFAENLIRSDMQNQIAGTFITRQFNIGIGVPRLYQVPALKDNVPRGMPGGQPIRYALFTGWSES